MKIKIGDSVKIKQGISDVDENISLSDWQGRVIEIVEEYDDHRIALINIEWDSITLKQMPEKFIINSEISGCDWTSYNIEVCDIELAKERDRISDVEKIIDKLEDKYAYAHLEDEGKRIMIILKGISSNDEKSAIKRWNEYLKSNLKLPENMEISEFQEVMELNFNDKINVQKIKGIDYEKGIIINGLWKEQNIDFPLCDLDVINKQSNNYQIVKDYCVWFANKW